MHLSEETIHYLSTLGLPDSIKSNFLITNLEKVIYVATTDKDNYYFSKSLSTDLLVLISNWQKCPIAENLFFMENKPSLKIVSNDTERYSAQMIFPIYLDNKIERSYYLF